MKRISKFKSPAGFSMVEVVVAVGLVALLLTAVLGLMAPATTNIDKALTRSESQQIVKTLEDELNKYRPSGPDQTDTDYTTAFDKAIDWMNGCNSASTCILVYSYSADMAGDSYGDGSLKPISRSSSLVQGEDYTIIPKCRRYDQMTDGADDYTDTLQKRVSAGKVYLVKFKGYDRPTTGVNAGKGLVLKAGYPDGGSNDITEENGMVVVQVEVYALRTNLWDEYLSKSAFTSKINKLGKPIYTTTLAFNR